MSKTILESNEVSVPFNSSMLKVGELMQTSDPKYEGHILLSAYEVLIDLTDPRNTFSGHTTIKGRKLRSGERVIITQ